MDDRLYEEKMGWFKENEKPEVVLFMGEDSMLTKIALAWTNTTTKRSQKLSPLPPHTMENGLDTPLGGVYKRCPSTGNPLPAWRKAGAGVQNGKVPG